MGSVIALVAGWWWLAWVWEFVIGEAERLENRLQLSDFLVFDFGEMRVVGIRCNSLDSTVSTSQTSRLVSDTE